METVKQESNTNERFLLIKENDFDRNYLEISNYCKTVIGFFRSEAITDLLLSEKPSEYEYENETIRGFYSCLEIFSNNIEKSLDKLYDGSKLIKGDMLRNA
jgi:hypothetical protein